MEPPDGPWDLKSSAPSGFIKKKYILFHGHMISPCDFGNIHFGFTGTALGIPGPGLDFLSGLANAWKGGIKAAATWGGVDHEWHDEGQINSGVADFWRFGPWLGSNFHIHFIAGAPSVK